MSRLCRLNFIAYKIGKICCIFSSNENEGYSGSVGTDRGRGAKEYTIGAGENPEVIIDDIDYYSASEGIQIVVFDNNYQRVVDNVILSLSDNTVQIFHQ